ncbi:MAG TPA: galactosyltransferase-related protein, partial [Lacipirellulaceae bacterium]|nr:galactosyltransferase-related protein [Lacipirellulaceae bacterium]
SVVRVAGDMVLHRRFIADHAAAAVTGRYLQGVRLPLTARATAAYLRRPRAIAPWHVDGLAEGKYLIRSAMLGRFFSSRPHGRLTRIHSCNQSYWRDDLMEINGFDERYNDYGGEDVDLCARLAMIGVLQQRLRFVALAYHLHHPPGANWQHVAQWPRSSHRAERGIDEHLPQRVRAPRRSA